MFFLNKVLLIYYGIILRINTISQSRCQYTFLNFTQVIQQNQYEILQYIYFVVVYKLFKFEVM